MTTTAPVTAYSGRSTNWPALLLVTAPAVALLGFGFTGDDWLAAGFLVPAAVVLVVMLVNLMTTTSVRTLAGSRGVTVHFGVLGWPRWRYPTERIASARVTTVAPPNWWWGIGWSRRHGLMLTLRSGPALELTLTNGRRVTITTPDPAAAVAALS